MCGDRDSLVRSGSFRRANEQALVKLLSEGKVAHSDLHYLEVLGHGSSGTVYRTFHQPSKIIMAVKVITLDTTQEEQRDIKAELDILHRVRSLWGERRALNGSRREWAKGHHYHCL